MPAPRHHWVVRLTHWVNAFALTLMVGSGLRIFNAYPAFARRGGTFCCWPFHGGAPHWMTFGGWLAGARNWHFAAMWLLVLNGLVYLGFVYLHGEWRDLVPRRGHLRDSWEMVRFYLFLRRRHPRQGKHNALQKTVYFLLPWLGAAAVITGIAIWKPVQLAPLTDLLGGYVWARYWHFMVMVALVALSVMHVFMVFAVDPGSLRSMITGGYDESRSPEALDARPFLRRRPADAPALWPSRAPARIDAAGAAGTDAPAAAATPDASAEAGAAEAPAGSAVASPASELDGASGDDGEEL